MSAAEQQKFREAVRPVFDNWIRDMGEKGIATRDILAARKAVEYRGNGCPHRVKNFTAGIDPQSGWMPGAREKFNPPGGKK